MIALLFLLSTAHAISFTGDAAKDFGESNDPFLRSIQDGEVGPDVGVPVQLSGRLSGWDIDNIHVIWDKATDELHFGIDCFGVCGDADGDDSEGTTSPELTNLGGQDLPGLARGEGIAIALDFNLDIDPSETGILPDNADVPFDFMFGVPAGQPADATDSPGPGDVAQLACSRGRTGNDALNQANCFGLYEYQRTTAVNIARRFLRAAQVDGGNWPVVDQNPNPTMARPDMEWTIQRFSDLKARTGSPFVTQGDDSWQFYFQVFAGSFLDAGVGEDYVPAQNSYAVISYPCTSNDECDICGGDGTSCLDCAGVPNGPNEYDECDVCAGDDSTCLDCAGMPNGPAVYDGCDVCDGDGTSCFDCAGSPAGTAVYDACDICDGDGSSCVDCEGVVNGPAMYDDCDVCNGDGTSCCGAGGKECCVNYCGVPDPYWDFILLPISLDNIIEKLQFTKEIFEWLCDALPPYDEIGPQSRDLHYGRVAEFNRLFLEECLEDFCEATGTLYSQLVADNAHKTQH